MILWIAKYWQGLAAGLLLVAAVIYVTALRAERDSARADRDIARAQFVTISQAFEMEKLATKSAVDAEGRCEAENAEQGTRCGAALDALRTEGARYRAQLKDCRTPDAVADRLGALFP